MSEVAIALLLILQPCMEEAPNMIRLSSPSVECFVVTGAASIWPILLPGKVENTVIV
jgi:hypothetical protein